MNESSFMAAEELALANTPPIEPISLPMAEAGDAHTIHEHEARQEPSEVAPGRLAALKLALMQKAPFFSRYLEAAAPAACCGACPNCIGTAVAGLALPFMKLKRENRKSDQDTDTV